MSPRRLRELIGARELLELRLCTAALDALSTALRLEHPSLDGPPSNPIEPPTLRAARRLHAQLRGLRAELRHYRTVLRQGLERPDESDELPF